MTPERKEEIRALIQQSLTGIDQENKTAAFKNDSELFKNGPVLIVELLAALEEAEKPDIKSINKIKKLEADLQSALAVNQKYLGDIEQISSELTEAQQTIDRLTEALTLIAEMKVVGSSYVSMQAIARGALIKERQEGEKTE